MKWKKSSVRLFIDNCTAHNIIPASLQCVKVLFLPPNTTSKLQPLDQGIIRNLKTLYMKEAVRQIISDIEDRKETSIDILQAMQMADKSWRNVTKKTIENCFKTCRFRLTSWRWSWSRTRVCVERQYRSRVDSSFNPFVRYSTYSNKALSTQNKRNTSIWPAQWRLSLQRGRFPSCPVDCGRVRTVDLTLRLFAESITKSILY